MAQDFNAAFGLGLGDKTIDTIDPNGVALAAIQGLNAELEELRASARAGGGGRSNVVSPRRREPEAARTRSRYHLLRRKSGGGEEQRTGFRSADFDPGQEGRRGRPESLEWVIAHLSPLVEGQVHFRLGALARNAADVEDLAAEVWTVALRKLPKLRPREGHYAFVLAKYLGTTASHLCNNFLRRAVRRKTASLGNAEASPDDSSARMDVFAQETRSIVTRIFHTEVTEMIRQALDKLDDDKMQVLVLRLLEHKSNQEIAALLDLKPNTVAVRYRRALEDLRESLSPG